MYPNTRTQTGLLANEEEVELNDIYVCVTLKGAEPDQTAIALTNWANNKGFCYKLSFPVYNESFTACNLPNKSQ